MVFHLSLLETLNYFVVFVRGWSLFIVGSFFVVVVEHFKCHTQQISKEFEDQILLKYTYRFTLQPQLPGHFCVPSSFFPHLLLVHSSTPPKSTNFLVPLPNSLVNIIVWDTTSHSLAAYHRPLSIINKVPSVYMPKPQYSPLHPCLTSLCLGIKPMSHFTILPYNSQKRLKQNLTGQDSCSL